MRVGGLRRVGGMGGTRRGGPRLRVGGMCVIGLMVNPCFAGDLLFLSLRTLLMMLRDNYSVLWGGGKRVVIVGCFFFFFCVLGVAGGVGRTGMRARRAQVTLTILPATT